MAQDPYKEETVDIKSLIFKYLRHWYWFVIALVIALTVAYFYNKFSETVYRTNATVLIRDDRKGGFRPGQFMGELDLFSPRRNIYNEMAIIRSYSLVDTTTRQMDVKTSYYNIGRIVGEIRKTEIYRNTPFVADYDPDNVPKNTPFNVKIISEDEYEIELGNNNRSLFGRSGSKNNTKRVRFGEEFMSNGYRLSLHLTDNYRPASHDGREYIFVVNSFGSLVSRYRSKISVEPLNPDVSIVEVTFEATNAQRASDFLNRLTENYIFQGLDEKNQIAHNTIRFIDQQIDVTTDSLYLAESSLQEFRSKHKLMDISYQANQLFTELSELDREKAVHEVKAQYYDYLLEYLYEGKDFSEMLSPSAMGIQDMLLNKLVSDLTMLYTERSRALLSSTEFNPYLRSLDKEIETTKKALRENIKNIIKSNKILLADLKNRINTLESRISMLPSTERELIGIQRKFNLSDATYNYLMEKRAEAGIALASNIPDNKIIDAARNSGIVSPKKNRNYLIAMVLGLIFPMGVIYLHDFFNTKIRDKKDVTSVVKYPVIGVIPHLRQSARAKVIKLVAFEQTKSPTTEAFRALRANLSFMAAGKNSKIVTVTSAKSEEGKTFTAVNLASVLALSGKKTLVLSADLRKPRIYQEFDVEKEPGLVNYLIGKEKLDDIIQKAPQNENLHVVTSGTVPPNPSELLESDKMNQMFKELNNKYDYVVIDTPPIGIVPDSIPVLTASDVVLFIVREKFSEKSSLEFLNDFAEKTKISDKIAIEINDVKTRRSGYGYSYSYGHGYGYGYGYGYGSYLEEADKETTYSKILKPVTENIKNLGRKAQRKRKSG